MSTPKITDAVILLLGEGTKTPAQLRNCIDGERRFDDLRRRWAGVINVNQVYAAMSGLRSKRPGVSLIKPIAGGKPGIGKPYALTVRGRERYREMTGAAPPVIAEQPAPTPKIEKVNHPAHYGGDTTYEAIKVIEAWELDFCLGNTVKYISRAGKKDPAAEVEDLKKAQWYLARRIKQLETPNAG